MKTADLTYVQPTGQDTEVSTLSEPRDPASVNAAQPAADQVPVQAGQSAANTSDRTSLPRTGTALPLVGLIGLTSLLGGRLRFRR